MADASEQIRRAWWRVLNATIVPAIRVAGVENVRFRQNGAPEHMRWILAYLTPRGVRDAFVFDTLRVGYKPSNTQAKQNEVTKEQLKEAAGAIAGATTTAALGIVYFSAALTAIGVNAAVVTAMATALTAALKAAGPMIGVVAVIAIIIAALVGILGLAEGKTLDVYLCKGIPVTDDIRRAIALRDQGGRLSDALALIAPREATPAPDGLGPGVPGVYPTIFREGDPIADQRALETLVATYLRNNNNMPCLSLGCGGTFDTNGWLGGELSDFKVDMRARRLVLAQFAGLGSAEAEWLSILPADRTVPEPPVPTTPKVNATVTLIPMLPRLKGSMPVKPASIDAATSPHGGVARMSTPAAPSASSGGGGGGGAGRGRGLGALGLLYVWSRR